MTSPSQTRHPPYQEVLEILPGLERQELLGLKARIEFWLGRTKPRTTYPPKWKECYLAIQSVLEKRRITTPSWAVFTSHRLFATFESKMNELEPYLSQVLEDFQKVERLSILQRFVGMVEGLVAQQGLPVSLQTLVNFLHQIPQLAEEQFPGYQAAGLFRWLLKRGA